MDDDVDMRLDPYEGPREPSFSDNAFSATIARIKQASRDQDDEDLRTGRKTREQLRRENSMFGSMDVSRFRINHDDYRQRQQAARDAQAKLEVDNRAAKAERRRARAQREWDNLARRFAGVR